MSPNNAFEDNGPLFSEEDLPLFEREQRGLNDDQVNEVVENVMEDVPPSPKEAAGIEQNVEKLERDGLWATARFYRRLLEKRDSTEG